MSIRCANRFIPALLAQVLMLCVAARAQAAAAAFDLAGPALSIQVSHDGHTLPIAQIPVLESGDHISLRPASASLNATHYLMVLVFLRGSTSPPPPEWFIECEAWKEPCATRGITTVVPADATQALLLFAPATRGDSRTLREAVRGRPGAFVRAAQELNQAALDRSRLNAYLTALRTLDQDAQSQLKDSVPRLARSLGVKIDAKCLDRIPELQVPCLMQAQDTAVLEGDHGTSTVDTLTTGAAADLAMQASTTPVAHSGYYSSYVASLLDIARLMGSIHSVAYQYIPALATSQADQWQLTLNSPPSFHTPMSVLVAALPAIQPTQLPVLRATDATQVQCAHPPWFVLPAEGTPVAFSTQYLHNLKLHVTAHSRSFDLPARLDPSAGGARIDAVTAQGSWPEGDVTGTLVGVWGTMPYEGPAFHLVAPTAQWKLAAGQDTILLAGRDNKIDLMSPSAACVKSVEVQGSDGAQLSTTWKLLSNDLLQIQLPLGPVKSGSVNVSINQSGEPSPVTIRFSVLADPGRLDAFTLHAGDGQGTLTGTRLEQVKDLVVSGTRFVPGIQTTASSADELTMVADGPVTAALQTPGTDALAKVKMKDGRTQSLSFTVAATRPTIQLLDKSVERSEAQGSSNIRIVGADDVEPDATLTFSLRAISPAAFGPDLKVDIELADHTASGALTLNDGLMLEDRSIAVATLRPAKMLGPSAFGPLRFRVHSGGSVSDWADLSTLVRLPAIAGVECRQGGDSKRCVLKGERLFLLEAVADDPSFADATTIPEGFTGRSLDVPTPKHGLLYARLRDDPRKAHAIALPSPSEAEQ